VLPPRQVVHRGRPLLTVHAASEAAAYEALSRLADLMLVEARLASQPVEAGPVVYGAVA
jgi:thymidine phosphorylase